MFTDYDFGDWENRIDQFLESSLLTVVMAGLASSLL